MTSVPTEPPFDARRLRATALPTALVSIVLAASYAAAALTDVRGSVLGVVTADRLRALVVVASVVTWLVASTWLRAATALARSIDPAVLWASSDWTAFTAWVIPIWSLFAPYLLVRDVRRAAQLRRPSSVLLLWLWWPTFVAITLLGAGPDGLLADGVIPGSHLEAAVRLACDLVSLACWLRIVHTTTAALGDVAAQQAQNITVENRAVSRNPTVR